jgi:hypothetical protein
MGKRNGSATMVRDDRQDRPFSVIPAEAGIHKKHAAAPFLYKRADYV